MRISKSRAFRDHITGSRLIICRCRTDEYILFSPALKQTIVTLNLILGKADELTDIIKTQLKKQMIQVRTKMLIKA